MAYEVKIDNKQVAAGDLEEDWNFLPPRKIKDLYAQKPRKWDECLQIEDPEDKKPEVRGCLAGKEVGIQVWDGRRRLGTVEGRPGAPLSQGSIQVNIVTQQDMERRGKQLTFVKDLLNLLVPSSNSVLWSLFYG